MASSIKPMLPPGVSATEFDFAIKEFRKIVGAEWVFYEPESLVGYSKIMVPDEDVRYQPSAAVAPDGVEQIQAILKVANHYKSRFG